MTNKKTKQKEEDEVKQPLTQEKVAVEIEIPEEDKQGRIRCLFSRTDPLTVFLVVAVISMVSVIIYHEFVIENIEEGVVKNLKHVVMARKRNSRQLSQILDRVDAPKIHGLEVNKAVQISEACDYAHCAVPCIRGRSQGFGNFLEKAIDVAAPIVSNIPFLPKFVSSAIAPVAALVKKVSGHPYSTVSNEYCARILDHGSGPDMGGSIKTGPSGMRALEYKPERRSRGRGKREASGGQQDIDVTDPGDRELQEQHGEGDTPSAEYLAALYDVQVTGDDEDDALDNVLAAIFSRLEL